MYQYKDHLGNIRINYTFDTATSSLRILEENNYYPFGLKHQENLQTRSIRFEPLVADSNIWVKGVRYAEPTPPMAALVENSGYQYKYQEQEFQDELGLNWYSYKYRNYDPANGRFMSIDPLTEQYDTWSPYVFSGNRVVDARELEGLEPHFPFKDKDSAAKDFSQRYNGVSILNDKEYGTKVYSRTDGDSNNTYSYADPVTGYSKSVNFGKVKLPDGVNFEAAAHTHAAYDPNPDVGNDEFSGELGKRTEGDMGYAERKGVDIYLAATDGSFQKYDVNTNKIEVLSKDLPSDPKNPKRLNKIDPVGSAIDLLKPAEIKPITPTISPQVLPKS